MKRSIVGALALAAFAAASSVVHAEAPKNVIFILGDGMGYEQTRMARYFFNGTNNLYNFEQLPNFAIMTHNNASGAVTDSAASATAIATGIKTANGVISVNTANSNSPYTTLLEMFKAQGKSTGLVTTSYMTDATPAAFGAHEPSRNNSSNIATDYLTGSKPNVLFGGAATGWSTSNINTLNSDYTVVTNKSQLNAINTETATHVAGVFTTAGVNGAQSDGAFAYYSEYNQGNNTFYNTQPTLAEMATKALNILDNNSNGFFLLLENELTDAAAHASSRSRSVHEVNQLASAVQNVLTWANNRTDTLVVVISDHETGGLAFTSYPNTGVLPTENSSDLRWTANGSHSASPIAIYAQGPNSQLFRGKIDNTGIISRVLAAGDVSQTKHFREGQNGTTIDTYIQQAAITTAAGGQDKSRVDAEATNGNVNTRVQSLLKFENLFGNSVGQIPLNATIVSASLILHTGAAANDESSGTMNIHRLLVPFDENSTWQTLTNGITINGTDALTSADGSDVPTQLSQMVSFDVTASVLAWFNGAPNHGWVIDSPSNNGWAYFTSEAQDVTQRPLLTIAYTLPVAAIPEPASLTLLAFGGVILLARRRR